MMILQFYSTVKLDKSQNTLKIQLIPPYQKYVLVFSLDVETQTFDYENS